MPMELLQMRHTLAPSPTEAPALRHGDALLPGAPSPQAPTAVLALVASKRHRRSLSGEAVTTSALFLVATASSSVQTGQIQIKWLLPEVLASTIVDGVPTKSVAVIRAS
ncbi:hypothetical protein EJB05_45191, partial [Eragrostis curvula]